MRGEAVQRLAPYGRVQDGRDGWEHRKGSGSGGTRNNPRPLESQRPQLLAGVEENAAPATHHRFPARRVVKDVRTTQPRREVVPGGMPEGRTLRGERP